MPAASDSGDGTTVMDGPMNGSYLRAHGQSPGGKSADPSMPDKPIVNKFTKMPDYFAEDRPFVVRIGKSGLIGALQELDQHLRKAHKKPTDWIGKEIAPGQVGLINHGGMPKLLTKPGRYPGFPLRNWWARSYKDTRGLSDNVISFQGLTAVQVSQNQAAVISDPQNHIFVLKNAGIVAYGIEGTYDVLAIVDQTHLPHVITDHVTNAVLGRSYEVRMPASARAAPNASNSGNGYVVALFMDIPANNCAILQSGNDLELLPAGQHCITHPNVTLRGLYTLGENQFEMPTKDIFTRDQVPVSLTLYLKWQLEEPLKLATHGYETPYDALRDKTQSILTQIVAHLDYSSMVKQRSIGGDGVEEGESPSQFLDALRTHAMDDLHAAALEYGIILKDLAVIDRQFKGEIASTMDKLTKRALQAQVEAANVDRENSNKVKQEEGVLSVARIKAQARNTEADAEAYSVIAAAKAAAERTRIEAEAHAHATRLAAEADAEATRIKARADTDIQDAFAQEMGRRRQEVARVAAFGSKTIFVPTEAMGIASPMVAGLAAGVGADLRK
ncbi:band 7 domain-containing protein [Gloeopeniophorella convolvens]|nr:band 7 domain-containing protein [Gloeopeniophorella convolvens]